MEMCACVVGRYRCDSLLASPLDILLVDELRQQTAYWNMRLWHFLTQGSEDDLVVAWLDEDVYLGRLDCDKVASKQRARSGGGVV